MRSRIFWTLMILLALGLVVLSSAGVIEGQRRFNAPYYFVLRQMLYGLLPGLLLMFALSRINYRILQKFAVFILLASFVLMGLVLTSSFGVTVNNARSWLSIAGNTFQPAEFLKLALVLYFAALFGASGERAKSWVHGTIPFLVVIFIVGVFLSAQPDIGTLGVIVIMSGILFFAAGARIRDIIIIAVLGGMVFGLFIWTSDERLSRVQSLMHPMDDLRGSGYQRNQSLIAIGSGGIFGVGFGHSSQKLGFLPETVNDSIFAIIAEEFGFVGASITIGLFVLLCFFLFRLAARTPDKFGQLFVIGMAVWVSVQAFVNIAAITGIIPLTGIPLPFISYGGTALVALLAGFGIVLNIAGKRR